MKIVYRVSDSPSAVTARIMSGATLWRESEIPPSLLADGVQGIEARVGKGSFECVTLYSHRDFTVPGFRVRRRVESECQGTRVVVSVRQAGVTEAVALAAAFVVVVDLARGGGLEVPALAVSAILSAFAWIRNRSRTPRSHPILTLLFNRLEQALAPVAS